MDAVRFLQDSFYQTSSSALAGDDEASPQTEPTLENGGVLQLPLWRVPWTEVPGRTNVLSVHEPMYTNMFEELIRRGEDWYFGHLYVPKQQGKTVELRTWQDEVLEIDVSDDERSAAVLGTLMKITDYRRMEDGKLLLLVQAVERFVVTEIVQEKPFGVARVQLLPDREEIQLPRPSATTAQKNNMLYTEQVVQPARASAVMESWQQWHPYEYESTPFPLPDEQNMSPTQVVGSALAKVLPYASFDTSNLPTENLKPPGMQLQEQQQSSKQSSTMTTATTTIAQKPASTLSSTEDSEPQKPLEVCLLEAGILKEVGVPDALLQMPLGELEINLWLAMNDFLVSSRTPVSPVLLGLLPPTGGPSHWPAGFVLERIADTINGTDHRKIEHKYWRVSPLYPSLRRQKRLAYCAAQLLEQRLQDTKNSLRQQLLQIPSTKLRLAFILWKFETEFGTFQ